MIKSCLFIEIVISIHVMTRLARHSYLPVLINRLSQVPENRSFNHDMYSVVDKKLDSSLHPLCSDESS